MDLNKLLLGSSDLKFSVLVNKDMNGDYYSIHPDGWCGYSLVASLHYKRPLLLSVKRDREDFINYYNPTNGILAKLFGPEKMNQIVMSFSSTSGSVAMDSPLQCLYLKNIPR